MYDTPIHIRYNVLYEIFVTILILVSQTLTTLRKDLETQWIIDEITSKNIHELEQMFRENTSEILRAFLNSFW